MEAGTIGNVEVDEAEVLEVVDARDVGGVETLEGVTDNEREGGNRSLSPVLCGVDERPLP